MKPNQWVTMTCFQLQTLPDKLDLLLARRDTLFLRQQELQERLVALACDKRDLIERQTVHELHWHVFWQRLRQSAGVPHSEETEFIPATASLPGAEAQEAGVLLTRASSETR